MHRPLVFPWLNAKLIAVRPPANPMDNTFHYWQLMRLDSSGRCVGQELVEVRRWLAAAFPKQLEQLANQELQLQHALVDTYRSGASDAPLAQLSLRCFISHQIRQVCMGLANRFGEGYGFTAADLFPLVLDDDGRVASSYQPLSLQILTSYDPTQARLSTWTSRLVKNHPELDRALLERGLYRASDWAILNDTRLEQLQRILRKYHLCSESEVTQASQLLQGYHQVYLRARIEQRRSSGRSRCQDPTPEQLRQMAPGCPAKEVLRQLKRLAAQLRQYRIHVRGGTPALFGEAIDWERVPHQPAVVAPSGEDDQEAFLGGYRQVLQQCLDGVLATAIEANMTRLKQRQPPRDQAYVRGLQLFHCEGLSMGNLASQVGLSSQVQVNRLLQLKRLRADVRHLLIPRLHQQVRDQAQAYIPPERLQQIDQTLEHLMVERVDAIIGAAATEAQAPKRSGQSLFSQQLCQTIHQFVAENR